MQLVTSRGCPVLSTFLAHLCSCMVGSCALPSVCSTFAHISGTIDLWVMKFGQNMDVDDPKEDLQGQCHGSKVKITRSKTFQVSFDRITGDLLGQGLHGSRSKVMQVNYKGQRWSPPCQKYHFRSHLILLQAMFKVKGHMGHIYGLSPTQRSWYWLTSTSSFYKTIVGYRKVSNTTAGRVGSGMGQL